MSDLDLITMGRSSVDVYGAQLGSLLEDMGRFDEAGVYPDWWKPEPLTSAGAWLSACAVIEEFDPNVRGVAVLGLDAPADQLAASLALAAQPPLAKGFAMGRTIFGDVAQGEVDDAQAVATMAAKHKTLCDVWDKAREEYHGDD